MISKAKEYFYQKEYDKALNIFLKNNCLYEAGLCALLIKDEIRAKKYWENSKKNSLGSSWGLIVLDFINLRVKKTPSFFQTRAFLEVYLNLFLENDLIEWAQNFVSCCETLVRANPESYKFIGRSLYANGYLSLAITFCKKSLQIFYSDPEAFLILSQCQFLVNDLKESLDSINKTLNIAPDYFPAQVFRKVIIDKISKNES